MTQFKFWFYILIIITFVFATVISAQDFSPLQSSFTAEAQAFTFAYGLYQDSLFQLAGKHSETFIADHPQSIKRSEAAFLSAECQFRLLKFQNAEKIFTEYIRDYPASEYLPEAYLKLGQSLLNQKKINEAISAFKIVLNIYGESKSAGEAAYWLGETFLRNDDTQNALKYYLLAYENYQNHPFRDYVVYAIAWTYQKRSEYSNAAEWYGKLITEFPKSNLTAGVHVRMAECLYYAKEYRRAIDNLSKIRSEIRGEKELGNADYLIAEAYYKLGDTLSAQQKYEIFPIDYPRHILIPEVLYTLGWIYLTQSKFQKAIESFDKLSDREDELGHSALYRRGVAELLSGQSMKAKETFGEVIQKEPQGEWSDNALFDVGMLLFNEGNMTEAILRFKQLPSDFPKSDVIAEGCRMLGECLLMKGEFSEAQIYFEKALAIANISFEVKVDATFKSAFCAYKLKKYNEAARKFEMFVVYYPRHPKADEAKYYQAETEYNLGNFSLALQLYQESYKNSIGSKREESLYGIAWSFYKQGKNMQAIESFEKLCVENPKSKFVLNARLRMGDAYFLLKGFTKAIGVYRTVIRMFPDSSSIDYAFYQIGESCLLSGDNTEAFKAFEGLVKTLPHSQLADDAQFALGRINYQQKEYGEAVKEFQKLVTEMSNSELVPYAHYYLGDSHNNLGQYDDAEKAYRKVLELTSDNNLISRATAGIESCSIENKSRSIAASDTVAGFDLDNTSSHKRGKITPEMSERILPKPFSKNIKKIFSDDIANLHFTPKNVIRNNQRDRETVEFEIRNYNSGRIETSKINSGYLKTGIGSYFSSQSIFQYGQVLSNIHYTLGGIYSLTKGYAPNTDRSGGGLWASGGTNLSSSLPLFQNAALNSTIRFKNESFKFYGSSTPNSKRKISDFNLKIEIEDQSENAYLSPVCLLIGNINVADSTAIKNETSIEINLHKLIPIKHIPIQTKLRIVSTITGLGFFDLSGGIHNYRYADLQFGGSLHLYWAKGMAGQNLFRVRPHLSAKYKMTSQHKVYALYEPMIIPMTLASNTIFNRFLAANSIIRSADVTDAGELGLESDWNKAIRSRLYFSVKSIQDLGLFSDFGRKGVWELTYGGRSTIVIICAEMFAKLESNDYFASSILFRSAKDPFWGGQVPYTPAIEIGCQAGHRFGRSFAVNIDVKFFGERKSDFVGTIKLPRYTNVDIGCDYVPVDFLKLSVEILNLTDVKYEVWRGYREFPLTAHIAVQVMW